MTEAGLVKAAALLIAALTQSPELLPAATEDKLHQSYRALAMPAAPSSRIAALRPPTPTSPR